MKRSRLFLLVGVLILAAAAVFVARRAFNNRSLETLKPQRGQITEAVYGLGKVKATNKYEVKLGILSEVEKLFVREGQAVNKGDKLLAIESGVTFRAPFAGTITKISNYEGETVAPQLPILRLEDLKDRFIELSLEQDSALRVRRGQKAKVSFETLRGEILEGQVTALFSREDEFLAHIEVQGLDESVLPGMSADVAIEIGKIENALLIPSKAISSGTVLIRRNGRQRKVKVEVGRVDGIMAEIKGGELSENDEVLIRKAE